LLEQPNRMLEEDQETFFPDPLKSAAYKQLAQDYFI
jgi:gluconokinase